MRVRWIPLASLLTAVVEVVVFVLIATAIGWGWAVLAAIVTSIVGALLLRHEGVRAWSRFRAVTAAGERPGPHLTRALAGLMGAFLLIMPGFVTDLIGAALFAPPVRALAARGLAEWVSRRLPAATMGEYFGPRRVRARTPGGRSARPPDGPPGGASGEASDSSGEILEGEIVDPR